VCEPAGCPFQIARLKLFSLNPQVCYVNLADGKTMKVRAMLEEQIRKIVELRHDAPYAVLGPHYAERERVLTIRAFLPQAKRASVLLADGSGQREMQKLPGLSLQVQKTVRGEPVEPRFLPINALRPLSLPKRQGERMEQKS
jgi:hypothetical protein